MKTTTPFLKKIHLMLGVFFFSVLVFSQNSTPLYTNLILCGENSIIPINSSKETKFTWSSSIPINAYIDFACTIPYAEELKTTIYLKPDLSQLDIETFTVNVTTYSKNDTTETQYLNIINNNKVWTGVSSNDWNDPNNWHPYGVPTASNCTVISGNTLISGNNYNAYTKNITIKPSSSLEIESYNNLTVTDWIKVDNNGVFKVKNNATILQINDYANIGKVQIEKTSKPMNYYDYSYWNSPLTLDSNFTLASLSPETKNDFWSYIPTISNGKGNWVNLNRTTIMNPTKGYIVKAPDTFSSNASTKMTFTAKFIGTPNNGPISVPISKGTNANIGGFVTDEDDEWNLIGNPYPSGIDALKLLNSPENSKIIDGTIYVWTHIPIPTTPTYDAFYGDNVLNYTSNDYTSFNKTGGTAIASSSTNLGTSSTGFIGIGESFFVKAATAMPNGTTANITFNNSMRTTIIKDNLIKPNAKVTTIEEKHRIWLNLTNNAGAFSQALIGYITNATQGLDRDFDGESFGGNDVTFYSIIPEAKLTIQGRSLPFDPNDSVYLGYNAAKRGNYAIRIDHLDGLFNEQRIYLEDKDLNIIHDLKQNPYSFKTEVGDFNNRFRLIYGNKTLATKTNNLNNEIISTISFDKNSNTITITNNSSDETIDKVKIYNIYGQQISTWKIENQDQQNIKIPINNIVSGIYIANFKTSTGEFNRKILIP